MTWKDLLQRSVALAISLAFLPQPSLRAEEAAEDEVADLSARVSRLESAVGKTHIGAWLDFLAYDDDRAGSDPFFDPQHLYLYLDNRFNEHWQAFGEIEIEHAAQVEGDNNEGGGVVKLERSYIQYNHSDWLRGRVGKFNTPSGYWTPIHWAINVDTNQRPIHEDNSYVPRKSVGLETFGNWFPEIGGTVAEIEYASFLSNGTEIFGTNHPQDGAFGFGLDLRGTLKDRYMLGFSYHRQRNPGKSNRLENNFTVYGNFEILDRITLRGEGLFQTRDSGFSDISVFYVKARWDFLGNAYLNLRFNYGDDDKKGAGDKHTAYTATLGYRPVPAVRFRLEYNRNSFEAGAVEDFNSYSLFVGYVF